jgi:hypothetical protein
MGIRICCFDVGRGLNSVMSIPILRRDGIRSSRSSTILSGCQVYSPQLRPPVLLDVHRSPSLSTEKPHVTTCVSLPTLERKTSCKDRSSLELTPEQPILLDPRILTTIARQSRNPIVTPTIREIIPIIREVTSTTKTQISTTELTQVKSATR